MSLIEFHKVAKAFGGDPVIEGATFALPHRAKVGLVGENGSGKSTILRLMAGEVEPDTGSVHVARSARLWHVPQVAQLEPGRTAFEEVLAARPRLFARRERMHRLEHTLDQAATSEASAEYAQCVADFSELGGYAFEREAHEALRALGIGDAQHGLSVERLSGGEQSRVALAKALLADSTALLLDESDNHLDIDGIEWLERTLQRHRGALVLVTHDRELLDRVVDSVLEIEDGTVTWQRGSYAGFLERKRDRLERQKQQYLEQQRRVRRLNEAMTRVDGVARGIDAGTANDHLRRVGKMVARKSKILKRRIQRELDNTHRIEKPREQRKRIQLALDARKRHARTVLRIEGAAKAFGERRLFADASLELARGERIALIGPNGTGKTTLMEIALGRQKPDAGTVWRSPGANAFYCDQLHAGIDDALSVYDTIARHTDLSRNQIHYLLARLLFPAEALDTRVGHLSGGERTRLVLALLMNTRADLLLLDEPTTHLDLPGTEVLEEALTRFAGAVLFISHDRRLVRAAATRVVELRDGTLTRRLKGSDLES